MKIVITFIAGLLFGVGLILSGMTSPDRVLGFLDVAGNWDPSLAFVMGGAVLTATPLFALGRRMERPIAEIQFDEPDMTVINWRLFGGSAIFGVGWGLAGICPGPALVDLSISPFPVIVFVAAMLGGVAIAGWPVRQLNKGLSGLDCAFIAERPAQTD